MFPCSLTVISYSFLNAFPGVFLQAVGPRHSVPALTKSHCPPSVPRPLPSSKYSSDLFLPHRFSSPTVHLLFFSQTAKGAPAIQPGPFKFPENPAPNGILPRRAHQTHFRTSRSAATTVNVLGPPKAS
ncbi:hypothetical protein CC78DRAFT_381910 [Lojkania enalia]|uniref:Uncharacterized protein n=1 Tax=Lojkania enalia TaxID=147567 RepID=A0A9P4K3P8_9PLEO|nr:hypothetical protein CC78DRAFT_381910 [Didymosphaeria enalia]